MTSSDYPDPPLFYIQNNYSILRGPPPIPADGVYSCFGKERKLKEDDSLSSSGREILFATPINYRIEMPKLLNLVLEKISLLLSLLGSNENVPEEQLRKFGDELSNIFVNILYLVNQYRTHQAREILIQLKKKQLNARKEMIAKIRSQIQNAKNDIVQSLDDMSNEAAVPPPIEIESRVKDIILTDDSYTTIQQQKSVKVADYIDSLLNS